MVMDLRRMGGVFLCAVAVSSCATASWNQDSSVTAGRWQTSPSAEEAGDRLPPRNEMSRPTHMSVPEGDRIAPSGSVFIGSEGRRDGAPGSQAWMAFHCGHGGRRCTVRVQVATPELRDNEHLVLQLERLDAAGNPVTSPRPTTMAAGTIRSLTALYDLSIEPCGQVRVSASAAEAPGGAPGIQSKWNVRITGFKCE